MKKRLLYAFIGVTLFALVLSGFGGYLLSRRQASLTARRQATAAATSLIKQFDNRATLFALNSCRRNTGSSACLNKLLIRIKIFERADNADLVLFDPSGQIVKGTLPKNITYSMLQINELLAGKPQSGLIGNSSAFAAIPLQKTNLSIRLFQNNTPVVILIRSIEPIFPNAGYFLFAALVSLVIAGIIALYLSTRISKPLITVAKTTDDISKGDLSARVPIEPKDFDELKELSQAINQMASSLESSKQMEREFFLDISHDLNTPLTSILGYAEAIADDISDNVKNDAIIIKNQAIRLQRLVQDILNLAKLESAQFAVSLAPENVSVKLTEIVEGFKRAKSISDRHLNIIADIGDFNVNAMLDTDRFKQIISNIVDNASKYADSTIEIKCMMSGPGNRVQIYITDDGPGIPASDISHIFNKYYRSKAQPSNISGSGLGLTIAKELANKMNITLEASSLASPNHGARFILEVPTIKN